MVDFLLVVLCKIFRVLVLFVDQLIHTTLGKCHSIFLKLEITVLADVEENNGWYCYLTVKASYERIKMRKEGGQFQCCIKMRKERAIFCLAFWSSCRDMQNQPIFTETSKDLSKSLESNCLYT